MFRKMTPSDVPEVLLMMREFYHSPAVLHPVPDANFEATVREVLSGRPYADLYLLEWEGKTAGYALTAKSWSNEAGGPVVWLEEAYVTEAFRGKGLGSLLLRQLEEEYTGVAARLRLEVEDDNEGAIRLYTKMGYIPLEYRQMIREL